MGDTVPQSAQSGGGELVQGVPPHLVPLPPHVEDDRAAQQLVGHDQEGGGRVERSLGGRAQLILLHLTRSSLNIKLGWGGLDACLAFLFIYKYKHAIHHNYPAI